MRNHIHFTACFLVLISAFESSATEKKPNILFVEVDDLPAHYAGAMGAKFAKTPNIDKLASDGFLFKNAVCQGVQCGPSRNSLMIGKYPHNLGFYQNGPKRKMPVDVWSLPAALQRANYHTAWVGKCHVHPNLAGIEAESKADIKTKGMERLGFDYVFQSLGRAMVGGKSAKKGVDPYVDMLMEKGLFEQMKNEKGKPTSMPEDIYMDGFFTKLAIDWLKGRKEEKRPFFLWLNYSCPHGPFDVAQKYHDLFADVDIPEPKTLRDTGEGVPDLLRPHKLRKKHDLKKMQRGFSANSSFVDDQLGRIMRALEEIGELDNTFVVFFSDHGILVGEHGLIHKTTLYKEVLNPTLIIYDPRHLDKKGKVIERPVELLDIVKTALEVAEASSEDKAKPFGETLLPLLAGEGQYKRKFAIGESPGFYAIVTEKYKCILPFSSYNDDDTKLLFDLEKDPDEMVNIAATSPEIVAKFTSIGEKFLRETAPILPPLAKKEKKRSRRR